MALSPGDRLSHYEIVGPLGKGGMGEVYRGRDTRLNRDVAIKVSDRKFSERFDREARVIASLNHPNICTLYDVGPDYLVMELVEGPTLAERIKERAIPLDEALAICRQMADALDYAHEKGVVHRDLKPGNIKIKPGGMVKVLDFGLAKVAPAASAASQPSDLSPTLTMGMTQAGMILGTAGYMPPEQARGEDVDKRADVWSFGVVLYEMLTGKRLFQGRTVADTLAAVIERQPDFNAVPVQVRRLLHMCLEKDPQKRLRHIGDVMALLDEAPASAPPTAAAPARGRWLWPAVGIAAVAVIAVAAAVWAPWRGSSDVRPIRFEIQPTENIKFITGGNPAVSPDGRWVAFQATGSDGVARQYIRALDSVEVRPLPGTESTGTNLPPPVFWSYDSRSVAYAIAGPLSPGVLKKLDINGGPPQTLGDVPSVAPGGAWNRDDVILVGTNNSGIQRTTAAGGLITPMTVLDVTRHENAHRFPQFLPDGRHFIYFRAATDPQYFGVYVGDIEAKPEEQSLKPLLLTDRNAVYSKSADGPGKLLFLRDTTLFAQTFDPKTLVLSGDPVPVADQVGSFPLANAGLFSVSETGVLAYRVGAGGTLNQLTWFDPEGKATGVIGDKGTFGSPSLSPDQTRIAVPQFDIQTGNSNIWVLDVARGTNTRLTFSKGRDFNPVWSPDGRTIIFSSNRGGHSDLYEKPADGSGEERLLLKSEEDKTPTSWSRDGRYLLYTNVDPKSGEDIWVLPLQGDRKPISFLRTEFRESSARFSPDGRWIAYQSNESGMNEIYVRPFSPNASGDSVSGGGKWLVSKSGGEDPHWRADGKELFYIYQLQQMAVDVSGGAAFQAGVPRRLFPAPPTVAPPDVSADGKRFLFSAPEGSNTSTPFVVVLNWQALLKK